jgi:hypothetical protein
MLIGMSNMLQNVLIKRKLARRMVFVFGSYALGIAYYYEIVLLQTNLRNKI